jgi:nucleotide-binding universal stress UspA family protein
VACRTIRAAHCACQKPAVAALVLGARGIHGGAQPAGRTALQVITQVSKPVLVVPPHAEPRQSLARILVPLDGTTDTAHALREIITLAHAHRLEILVLHVLTRSRSFDDVLVALEHGLTLGTQPA